VLILVGVMGGGACDDETAELARELGAAIAAEGWALLTGGRDAGAMRAASAGCAEAGGLVVGVLPGEDWSGVAPGVGVAILTGMGSARNAVNALSSRALVALPGGAGTLSEIALAVKAGRPVWLLGWAADPLPGWNLPRCGTVAEVVAALRRALGDPQEEPRG